MLIARRFVRIKALQNLYAYTISQQAHKKEAIEQIEKDFIGDHFINESEKQVHAKERAVAVALFCKMVAEPLPASSFSYAENSKVEQSIRKNLLRYKQALLKDQTTLQARFNQSKESIYADYLYILLLLIEWYKLAKEHIIAAKQTNCLLLQNQLAKLTLLAELYQNINWISFINKKGISWSKEQDRVQTWYTQLIKPVEIPTTLVDTLDLNNSIKLLEHILQTIIFKRGQVRDFFSMMDLYWDEHKRVVKNMLVQTFKALAAKDFIAFTLSWQNQEEKWREEAVFYNRLVEVVIQKNNAYETMISNKAKKWDSDRMVLIDKLILKLALAELFEFQAIPLKVSINEYIEIAKLYGTPKSGPFINGILDGILKHLQINV